MDTQLLREQEVFPSEEILKQSFGGIYPAYEWLMETVTGAEYGLTAEWNYYKDGRPWLCKVTLKKKTVFWLSVWESWFQISFYFIEKHLEKIAALDIDEKIKEDFCRQKPVGKLIPMIFKISHEEQLGDLLKMISFKKALK